MSVVELLRELREFWDSLETIPLVITAVITVITALGWIFVVNDSKMHWIKKVMCYISIPIGIVIFFLVSAYFIQMVYELIIALTQIIPVILVIILAIIIILIMG